ncbi:hypothetical protein WMF27_14500 [Sorangium sp. So ce281]|uniref:hypothetical protein n=1 Tax=unclassified Sorangium TaxID=2621164 RepID=UPI003F60F24A
MGECYVRGHGTEGAGGGIITPTGGVGGFGYVPLEPQNHTGYDEDPCSAGSQLAECTVTWKAGSIQLYLHAIGRKRAADHNDPY